VPKRPSGEGLARAGNALGTCIGSRPRAPREPRGGHTWAKIIVLLVLLGLPAGAQEPFPAPQGRVNDFAQVLEPSTTAQLNALVAEVEQRTTAEIAKAVAFTASGLACSWEGRRRTSTHESREYGTQACCHPQRFLIDHEMHEALSLFSQTALKMSEA
jgi:hypothetical protein